MAGIPQDVPVANFLRRRRKTLWRVEQYGGQSSIDVQATQLDDRGVAERREQKLILAEWIEFLGTATCIRDLNLVSRVPQELLDAVAGQRPLAALAVKWGPYANVDSVLPLAELQELSLGGARAVRDLEPLVFLPRLRTLSVDQPFAVTTPEVLGRLPSLENLTFGNADPGSDRTLDLTDLEWIGQLRHLRTLHLPGTRLPVEQLPVLADLPNLVRLRIPLRPAYRAQVFELAPDNRAFAEVARQYERSDDLR